MRAIVQRVSKASVAVESKVVGSIGSGLVVFLGISRWDSESEIRHIVDKVTNLRIFADHDGKFNYSVLDIGAELLLVSQFTLYGDTRRGRRPSFVEAATPERAKELFNIAIIQFKETGLTVQTGQFQSHMLVSVDNDGPATVILDSADRDRSRNE